MGAWVETRFLKRAARCEGENELLVEWFCRLTAGVVLALALAVAAAVVVVAVAVEAELFSMPHLLLLTQCNNLHMA